MIRGWSLILWFYCQNELSCLNRELSVLSLSKESSWLQSERYSIVRQSTNTPIIIFSVYPFLPSHCDNQRLISIRWTWYGGGLGINQGLGNINYSSTIGVTYMVWTCNFCVNAWNLCLCTSSLFNGLLTLDVTGSLRCLWILFERCEMHRFWSIDKIIVIYIE